MGIPEIQHLPMFVPDSSGRLQLSAADPGGSFKEMLTESIGTVNRLQQNADQSIEDLTTGRHTDIHKTMVEMEKADTSFQLLMQVRNKMVSAYEEIMRMQV